MLFNVWTQFYSSIQEDCGISHTSGSLASLLGMCAFQVCRKQCCILHFRVRTWEIPASLTCQKLPKWCCNSYRHMYCSFIHPLFYCILGLFYKHRVPSLQVSNYRSSRAWCDQSNKIDRVRGAKRNWKSPRSILKFQSYNSLVRFAKPLSERPIGSQITGLQFEGCRTQRKKSTNSEMAWKQNVKRLEGFVWFVWISDIFESISCFRFLVIGITLQGANSLEFISSVFRWTAVTGSKMVSADL